MTDIKDPLLPNSPPPSYSAASTLYDTTLPPALRPSTLDLPLLRHLRTLRFILASASPRRATLLADTLGLHPSIIPSTLPENLPKSLSPIEYVLRTATQKCMHVYQQQLDLPISAGGDPELVLAADTIVVAPSGKVLEKPRSETEHVQMLMHLRDVRQHKVYTAVVAMAPLKSARDPGYALESHVEETSVWFAGEVGEEMIRSYVRSGEGKDKAGGYAVQGIGAVLVERIEGSWDNVVGLPVRAVLRVVEKALEKGEEEELEDEGDEED